jgi:hypothetical protein
MTLFNDALMIGGAQSCCLLVGYAMKSQTEVLTDNQLYLTALGYKKSWPLAA